MEIEKLLKERDAYAGKILKLGITIAVIFLFPAIIAVLLGRYYNFSYVYTLGGAFIISWTGVVFLYRKISREVKHLEERIHELRKKEDNNNQHNIKL